MEVRFVLIQPIFAFVGGAMVAYYFGWPWWGYALLMPAMAAVSYVLTRQSLRARGLKPDATYVDYIEACKRQWEEGRE